MSRLVKKWIPILIATVTGLTVLSGYLFPNRLLVYYRGRLTEWRDVLVEWAVIVAAFAFILGTFNILRVHGTRIVRRRQGWLYSLVLLFTMLVAIIPPVLPPDTPIQKTFDLNQAVMKYIIGPVGASLGALLVFTLTLAAFRLLRARRSLGATLFVAIVVTLLLGSAPLVGLEPLASIRAWIIRVPGMAGMRGLLLGVALGTTITALRVFIGRERPYSES
jgi:hypothetical protein